MPDTRIVDAWALLAWVRDERPASLVVRGRLQQAEEGKVELLMSWVNAGEVYYMLARKHNVKVADTFLKRLPSLPVRLVVPNEAQIIAAAKLKSLHRLSYADAFAVALSFEAGATLITGDPEIRALAASDGRVTVEWIGPTA